MKWLIYTVITVAVAAGLAMLAIEDQSYVLINIADHVIESKLTAWVVILVLAFVVFYWLVRVFVRFRNILPDIAGRQDARRKSRGTKFLLDGLVKLAEGDWQEAEKKLLKYANDSSEPMLNYLSAARAAHEQNVFERRDRYLTLANQLNEHSDIAVKLTLAEFQHDEQLQEQALATLNVLQQVNPRHRTVLRSLATLHLELHQWEAFLNLVPQLRKLRIFKAEDITSWEQRAYIQLLRNPDLDGKALESLWYRMPSSVQAQQPVLVCYVQQLVKQGRSDVTETLIRNALRKHWNIELVRLYGIINGADARAQLAHAESWLKDHEHNPILLLTLGRLSLRNQLWGKARSYFEASIGANGPAESYNELAQLLEKLGEIDRAMDYYREGLRRTPQCETAVAATINPLELEPSPSGSNKAVSNAR